ncbi:MAG: tetratricopeptide repeat protein [Anaerolineae bacterium]|nr:tetratricopeptide repeat protein [Anaerolineae bacterium]
MHILIRQTDEATASPFQAEISFNHGTRHPITITDPFNAEQEAELEWYFETWLELPFINTVRARKAAESITTYGTALFEQVFDHKKVYAQYDRAKAKGVSQFEVEIAGTPAFHALHWEALQDPDRPPLAVDATILRKLIDPATEEIQPQEQVTLNILMVVARPGGRRDVGYRTIARPLVEALRDGKIRAQIDIVRPGTYEALTRHLEATRQEHGDGFYQIVHLDLHGSLLTHEQYVAYQASKAAAGSGAFDEMLSPMRYGERSEFVPDVEAFEGQRGFLSFVGAKEGWSDLVIDTEIAALLQRYQIPIAVLNACQSGKQVGAAETSLGARLVAAGVQQVVAMGYSVTVTAAERLMTTVYQQLLGGQPLPRALQQGRWELHKRKKRRAYFNEEIPLEDWMLPVVYQNQSVSLTLRDFRSLDEENAFYLGRRAQYRAPRPEFGFVGRDVDILEIERRLLRDARSNLLLLRGMGGVGKTTLLRHLMEWWQTTGFVTRVVYFGYDEKAWTTEQIIDGIGRVLLGDAHYNRELQPLMPDARQQKLVDRLRAERHLLVLDNLESITGTNLAVLNTLDAQEQARLRDFVQALVGGRTLVLLGSRGGEGWLLGGQVDNLTYRLPGLDEEAASTLAERILKRYDKTAYHSDDAFRALLKLLDGYPLALEVVLANLQRQTPADVLAALQKADVAIDPNAEGGDKTTSIVQCIEYSHSNLSPAAQELLLCLAPFTGVVNTDWLGNYVAALQQQPELAHLDHSLWQEVLQEAVNWGLMTPHEIGGGYLRLQPVFPYFLKTRLGEGKSPSPRPSPEGEGGRKAAIEAAFRAHYDGIGGALAQMITSKEPQQKQIGQTLISVEYENLMSAVRLSLATQTDFYNAFEAVFRLLHGSNQHLAAVTLCQEVIAARELYSAKLEDSDIGVKLYLAYERMAFSLLEVKDYAGAQAAYEEALEWIDQLPSQYARYKGAINHQLGRVAQAQRQWDSAEAYYQQALTIYREFNDRYSQASTLHQLGRVAEEQRQWDSAEAYYQQALTIKREFNDRYEQAGTLHQLGSVAEAQRQWDAAEAYYQQALTIYREFNDRYSQASTLIGLGVIAENREQFAQAADYHFQAAEIYAPNQDYNLSYATRGLARVWQAAQAQSSPLAAAIVRRLAALFDETPENVEQLLREASS